MLDTAGAWIQYNSVDFGKNKFKSVSLKVLSKTGCTIQLLSDKLDNPVIDKIIIPKNNEWKVVNFPIAGFQPGIHNLILLLKDDKAVEVDWIKFE